MINKFSLLSTRAEHLREFLQFGRLQALGELTRCYVLSDNISPLRLTKVGFSESDLAFVLEQLGIEKDQYELISFPNSNTITLFTKKLSSGLLLSVRCEDLKNPSIREPLQVLSELVKSYIITKSGNELILKKNFSKTSIDVVLKELNIDKCVPSVFPNSTTTSLYFFY